MDADDAPRVLGIHFTENARIASERAPIRAGDKSMFKKRVLGVLLVVVAAPVLVGGSTACVTRSCQTVCEKSAKADCDEDGVPDGTTANCTSTCKAIEALNGPSGCGQQWDDYLKCADGLADTCTSGVACAAQMEAYSNCSFTYCQAHATAPECAAPV
jgi:hypothetical protein